MPAEWQGQAGFRAFVWGDAFTVCLGRYGRDWYATSNEATMARLAGHMGEGDSVHADLLLHLDLEGLFHVAQQIAMAAADQELLPYMNAQDLQAIWSPRFHAFAALGSLQILGNAADATMTFEGRLLESVHAVEE